MAKERGRSCPLSPFRRLVTDMMWASMQVPGVALERRMNLGKLVAARTRCTPRPGWTVIFAKALALVARTYPDLRRSYMKFPWPRLYEHPYSTAALNVERQLPSGEPVVVQCLIKRIENRSLAESDAIIRHIQAEPLENLRWYQRSVTMSKVPWLLRRWLWWATLNVFGRRRCHNFGTFGLTSVAAQGAGVFHLLPLLTSMIHYGLFDEAGNIDMRFAFDHRVLDGTLAAHILCDLERTLLGEILAELQAMRPAAAAA